jgi:hypothetical protein
MVQCGTSELLQLSFFDFAFMPRRRCPVWLVTADDLGGIAQSHDRRALRLCLLRLHLECENLRNILRNIAVGNLAIAPRSDASERFQLYLDDALNRIVGAKKDLDGYARKSIYQIARAAIATVFPTLGDELINSVSALRIRGNLFRRLENVNQQLTIEKMTNINVYGGQFSNFGNEYNGGTQSNVQLLYGLDSAKLEKLSAELGTLRAELLRRDPCPERAGSVAAIEQAEEAAKKGNSRTVLECLPKAGKWTLDVAKDIGVELVASLLEKQIKLF